MHQRPVVWYVLEGGRERASSRSRCPAACDACGALASNWDESTRQGRFAVRRRCVLGGWSVCRFVGYLIFHRLPYCLRSDALRLVCYQFFGYFGAQLDAFLGNSDDHVRGVPVWDPAVSFVSRRRHTSPAAAFDLICSTIALCTCIPHAVPLVRANSASLVVCLYIYTPVMICDVLFRWIETNPQDSAMLGGLVCSPSCVHRSRIPIEQMYKFVYLPFN